MIQINDILKICGENENFFCSERDYPQIVSLYFRETNQDCFRLTSIYELYRVLHKSLSEAMQLPGFSFDVELYCSCLIVRINILLFLTQFFCKLFFFLFFQRQDHKNWSNIGKIPIFTNNYLQGDFYNTIYVKTSLSK